MRHCSQNEVFEVEFALSESEATQLGESPETAFVGLVREGRGDVRVRTLTAEESENWFGPHSLKSAASWNTQLPKLPRDQVCIPQHSCE